jgi:hypothetical protein
MKKEVLSVIIAMVLSITFLLLLTSLILSGLFIVDDIRAELTAILINVGIIGSLVWGFKPALQLVIFGKKPNLSNQQLKTHTIALSNDINFFVEERKRQDPSYTNMRHTSEWENYTRKIIDYSSETNSLFHIKFDQRIADLREEFELRKIFPVDGMFAELVKFPCNYFGIEEISQTLTNMAAKI